MFDHYKSQIVFRKMDSCLKRGKEIRRLSVVKKKNNRLNYDG